MVPIGSIAVGFDGSRDARAALLWAARVAAATEARLKVVHAVGLLEHAGISLRDHAAAHQDAALEIAVGAGVNAPGSSGLPSTAIRAPPSFE